jgi:Flp pilus assembly protein TadG
MGVGRIVMDLPPSSAWGTRTQTIQIQGSTDGTNYTTLVPSQGYTFDPSTGNTASITFTSASVRYVKLTFTANTGWPAGQLSELQVYSS